MVEVKALGLICVNYKPLPSVRKIDQLNREAK